MASKTASAWAKPEHTPAPEPAREPLVVVSSGAVAEDRWAEELPTSPKSFIKLARENGYKAIVLHAVAERSGLRVESWRVALTNDLRLGCAVVWEQHSGDDSAKTKQKCHVGTAYLYTKEHGVEKTTVTHIKNAIKESK